MQTQDYDDASTKQITPLSEAAIANRFIQDQDLPGLRAHLAVMTDPGVYMASRGITKTSDQDAQLHIALMQRIQDGNGPISQSLFLSLFRYACEAGRENLLRSILDWRDTNHYAMQFSLLNDFIRVRRNVALECQTLFLARACDEFQRWMAKSGRFDHLVPSAKVSWIDRLFICHISGHRIPQVLQRYAPGLTGHPHRMALFEEHAHCAIRRIAAIGDIPHRALFTRWTDADEISNRVQL